MASHRALSAVDVARTIEAAVGLAFARVVRGAMPSRRWQPLLGRAVRVAADAVPSHRATGVEWTVSLSVARAGRRLPWHATCLDQALAAQLMLRRRGQPGTAVIGLRPGTGHPGENWPAHAWLVGTTGTVVGLEAGAGYTPVSGFRPSGPGRR